MLNIKKNKDWLSCAQFGTRVHMPTSIVVINFCDGQLESIWMDTDLDQEYLVNVLAVEKRLTLMATDPQHCVWIAIWPGGSPTKREEGVRKALLAYFLSGQQCHQTIFIRAHIQYPCHRLQTARAYLKILCLNAFSSYFLLCFESIYFHTQTKLITSQQKKLSNIKSDSKSDDQVIRESRGGVALVMLPQASVHIW